MTADIPRLRAALTDGRCLCSSTSTDRGAVAALLDENEALRATVARVEALADGWDGYGHGTYNVHLEDRLPCSACDLLAELRAALDHTDPSREQP